MTSAAEILLVAGLLMGVLAGWILMRARAHEAHVETTYPPEGQILSVDGQKVHVVVMGPDDPSAPDLVLIHGSSGNTRDMTFALAPALARHFRVFVLDRPGLGYSDRIMREGPSLSAQAMLLRRASETLGARRPILVGHSYGGAVALAWAVNHPDALSALVAISAPSHPWKSGLSLQYRVLSHPVLGPLVAPAITALVPDAHVDSVITCVFSPDPVPEGYRAHFGAGLALRRESLRANALQRATLLREIEALFPRYDEIGVPVEILHGSVDPIVGFDLHAKRLSRDIAGARLTKLEGHGHMPHHSCPDQMIEAILNVAARARLRDGS